MSETEIDQKLTPAAREVLNEVVNDYRRQILLKAGESAALIAPDVREVSVHDVLAAVERERDRRKPRATVDRVLSLYALSGGAVGVAGLFAFFYPELTEPRALERQLPLMAAVAGLLTGLAAVFVLRIRRARDVVDVQGQTLDEKNGLLASFIAAWAELERIVRGMASSIFGDSMASAPFSVLLQKLVAASLIADHEEKALRNLIQLRNAVIHGQMDVSATKLRASTQEVESLFGRFRERSSRYVRFTAAS